MPTNQPSAERPRFGHESAPFWQIFAAYTKPSESAKPDSVISTSTSSEFQLIPVMYAKTGRSGHDQVFAVDGCDRADGVGSCSDSGAGCQTHAAGFCVARGSLAHRAG